MRKLLLNMLAVLTFAGMPAATPAYAWKFIKAGETVKLKKSGMLVTPPQDWNKDGSRPGKKAESWTLDGYSLNHLTFFGGIKTGDTLYKDRRKKEQPLPAFDSSMLIPDIVQWVEANKRLVFGTALFEVQSVEPAQFAGHSGFRFKYTYVTSDDDLKKRGDAVGAMIDGQLYLIDYVGADLHYFERDLGQFETIVTSVQLTK